MGGYSFVINSPTALFEMTWPSMAGGSKNQTGITKIRNLGSKTNQTRHQKQNIKSPGGYTQDHKFSGHTKIKQGSTQKPNTETRCKEQTACGRSGTGSHSGDSRSSYTLNTPPHLATLLHHLAITSPFI